MLYLLSNQANTLCVTWTERYTSTDSPYVILELKSALNEVLSFSLLKAANTSQHTERYDLFAITLPETDKGQYTYTVYESTSASVADKTAVLETGLAFVEYGEDAGVAWDASVDYVAFGAEAPTPMIVDTPVIQPNAGTYAGFVTLTMTCATAGSRIYYTTDGTIPTSQNGTLYDGDNKPVITASTLVLARAYADGMQFSALASSSFVVTPVTLTAIPSGGTFLRSTPPTVVLVSNSETAEIYTTTNGDDPTVLDTPYAPITPTVITRWKGRAFDPPAAPSNIVDETYNIQATQPTLDTDSGTYISSRTITATNTNPSGTNEYSVDGGAYVSGDVYTAEQTEVVAFRTVASGVYITSDPTTINVEIQVATPTASPNGGEIAAGDPITLACATSGATIYFTTDGSTPTTSSTEYTVPITSIAETATLKAIAVKAGLTNSAILELAFSVPFKVWIASVNNLSNGRIYQSLDKGASWSELQPLGNISNLWGSVGGFDSGAAIFVMAGATLYRSTDKGANWTTITSPNDNIFSFNSTSRLNINFPLQIQKGSSGTKMIMLGNVINAAQSNLFLSTDSGASFTAINMPPVSGTLQLACVLENGWILASAIDVQTNGIFRSKDDGATWEQVYAVADHPRAGRFYAKGNAIYIGLRSNTDREQGVLFTLNGGDTWTFNVGIVNFFGFADNRIIGGGQFMAITADRSLTYYSDDNFATQTSVDPTASSAQQVFPIVATSDGDVLVSTNNRLYLSTDNGLSYSETQPAGDTRNWHGIAMIGYN